MPPDKWTYLYFAARRVLEALGERNPQGWIGKEPDPGDPQMVLSAIMPILMQGAQAGDPVAAQVLQTVQQLMEQAQQEGGGQDPNGQQPAQQGMVPGIEQSQSPQFPTPLAGSHLSAPIS